ncbi:hypothetical protein H5410_011423 [Solanum commersonii]|uniref:Uncharacterized protein n=1 Tax=Solanum commersonii TaxID=4109 RepID=A0A9J6ANK8_SOLCO|nr:hypothetical protein H5410_011423 [Solanum commersonii]
MKRSTYGHKEKSTWISKKFSVQAFFIQSLYAYCIGYMVSTHSFFSKLGGLYETQPFKQKSAEYARAKDLGIKRASDMVDVENIKHIAQNQTLIGDVVGKTAEDWKTQKELFYHKTGISHQTIKESSEKSRISSPDQKWLKRRMAMKTSVRNLKKSFVCAERL